MRDRQQGVVLLISAIFFHFLILVGTTNGFLLPPDLFRTTRLAYPEPAAGATGRTVLVQKKYNKLSRRTSLSVGWSDNELQGSDRIKACVPYILPLMDGDPFGAYIYERIPPLNLFHEIFLEPLVYLNQKIPFFGLGLFLVFTLGTRFNTDINRNVRFSAQQAALIDLALLFPELIASSFAEDPVPRSISEPCANFVYYTYMSAVIYSIYSNLRGKRPDEIPYISPSADLMVGPF